MINDEKLRAAYEQGLPDGADRPVLDDLAAERLRRLVEREGPEAERLHTVDGLLSTAGGRVDLDIVLAASRAARQRARPAIWWRAAAGVLIAAGAWGAWLTRPDQPQQLRGPDESPINLVAPRGLQVSADRFVWRALAGIERYTLVVVDTAGAEVFASETSDTSVVLPDSVHLSRGQRYLWWVQARTPLGESVTAVTQQFQIR
jgi:hypothetical protein